jgi:hypothetical protein
MFLLGFPAHRFTDYIRFTSSVLHFAELDGFNNIGYINRRRGGVR